MYGLGIDRQGKSHGGELSERGVAPCLQATLIRISKDTIQDATRNVM